MDAFDLWKLRNAFGTFMTGVTVVTTREPTGIPRGFTANSFTSVSLDPPLLLICIDKASESIGVFTQSDGFAVNILAADQIHVSGLFASKRIDKYDRVNWYDSQGGFPLLEGVCAWFDCQRKQVINAGDHVILLGAIKDFGYNERNGLGYVRGGYMNLGLEQSAVEAAESSSDVVVGAIVEYEGKILLLEEAITGTAYLPASGLYEAPGSIRKLQNQLNDLGIGISITSLYAVFENEQTHQQSIYYRAKAESDRIEGVFYPLEAIPWERLGSEPIRTMLKRYHAESRTQRFGIYFGSDRDGDVTALLE